VLVAWNDDRAGNTDIYAIRIDASGARAAGWPIDGRAVASDARPEANPVILSDGRRGAFIAWTFEYSGSDLDLYAARIDSIGGIVWSAPIANPSANQTDPALAMDGSGGVILTYTDDASGWGDIRAARRGPTGAGIYGPVTVCDASSVKGGARVAGDGTGRAIIAWQDARYGGSYDIYAAILTPSGAPIYGFPSNGKLICGANVSQWKPRVIADGAGGAYIAWEDERSYGWDLYMQRLLPSGFEAPGWPDDGVAVCTYPEDQKLQDLAPDGKGGAIVVWRDRRTWPASDIYASRVLSTGAVGAGWVYGGTSVTLGRYCDLGLVAVSPDGDALVTYTEEAAPFTVRAQSIERFGQLGSPEPRILGVRDVSGDQGGRVRLDWKASYLDADPAFGVGAYWIWRQAPAAAAQRALAQGARLLDETPESAASKREGLEGTGGLWMITQAGDATYYWEYLAAVQASAFPRYSYVAATTTDSTAGANPRTPFLVQARAASGVAYWTSAADSGYSVDNLPPAMPAPFVSTYDGGSTRLHWGANTEADLAGYRLYRGSSAGFVPGTATLLATPPDTGYADPGPPVHWYKLTAVDTHGNESPVAVLAPTSTVTAPLAGPIEFALLPARPNPVRGQATLRFATPRASHVRLAIFDAQGRQVRTLVDAPLEPGVHEQTWDLADRQGRAIASGRYFLRLEAEGRTIVESIAVLR
jgi:hypothetical protein